MGVLPGTPDLCILKPDTTIFLELKTYRGTLSKQQLHVGKQIMDLGHVWLVAFGMEDMEEKVASIRNNTWDQWAIDIDCDQPIMWRCGDIFTKRRSKDMRYNACVNTAYFKKG